MLSTCRHEFYSCLVPHRVLVRGIAAFVALRRYESMSLHHVIQVSLRLLLYWVGSVMDCMEYMGYGIDETV
jgi:hypothetical protein